MSFSEQLGAAIAAARTYQQIENLSREIWAAYAARVLNDDSAQAAAELLHARKRALRDDPRPAVRKPLQRAPRRPAPRSPDRAKSIVRRRACATSGAVPSKIAADFTQGETAVLSIVAAEVKRTGECRLCIDAIAAMAGVCRRLAQTALRHAEEEGLVSIEERPQPGRKSLPNIVRVTSKEWRAWLRLGHRMQTNAFHGNIYSNNGPALRGSPGRGLSEGGSGEATPLRPGPRGPIERNDRLEAALARFEASVRARAAG